MSQVLTPFAYKGFYIIPVQRRKGFTTTVGARVMLYGKLFGNYASIGAAKTAISKAGTDPITENLIAIETAREALQAHCMAARIITDATHLTVYFPPGYPLDGVRVSWGIGKAQAYRKALSVAEQTWTDSYPSKG